MMEGTISIKKVYYRFIILLLLFFCSIDLYSIDSIGGDSSLKYVAFALFLILTSFIFFLSDKKPFTVKFQKGDLTPFLIILTWLYGVVVGMLNGNKTELVFRNFAGFLVYIFFYILIISRIKKDEVFRFLIVFFNIICVTILGLLVMKGLLENVGKSRIIYSTLQFYVFALIPLYLVNANYSKLANFIFLKSRIIRFTMLLLMIVVSVLTSFSKGMFLALSVVLLLVSLTMYNAKKKYIIIVLVFFGVIGGASLYLENLDLWNVFVNIFNKNEVSNSSRVVQINYLVDEFTFFGKGLGAGLSNGFYRDPIYVYSYEVTYHNLIHKLGFFSIILFYSYLIVFIKVTRNLIKKQNIQYSLLALGCVTAFICMGIGNPVLLAPSSVVLHCFALFLLRK